MRIIGFGLDPNCVYSTKYRLDYYKDIFKQNNITLNVYPTKEIHAFKRYYDLNKHLGNLVYYGFHLFDIFVSVLNSSTYDAVFIQRHLFPGKISFLEKLLVKMNKNIIFDFDDAIFSLPKHFRYKNWEKDPNSINEFNKVKFLIKNSKLVIAGNNYLAEYAKKYNQNIIIVPTPIDIELFKSPKTKYKLHKPIRIGWYGSWGNQPYLESIMPAIENLSKKYNLELRVISDKDYYKDYPFIKNIKWNEKEEEKQMSECDITIAPLPRDEWTRGKCGYKILKYMICGLPSVVSPIEIQKDIIEDMVNGFHADSILEWEMTISKLIKSEELRKSFGIKSRTKIIEKYSREKLGKIIIENIKAILP